jgi:hypothetical protein
VVLTRGEANAGRKRTEGQGVKIAGRPKKGRSVEKRAANKRKEARGGISLQINAYIKMIYLPYLS